MKKIEFGAALPTGMEGLMYRPPFTTPEVIVEVAQQAEALGFDHVWGNEHFTTQDYVRQEFASVPNYYDPFVSLSFCAAATKKLRIATCITVIPLHDPVILAKQVATLDRFSGGRFILGAGTGAYREEFEALRPTLAKTAKRSDLINEGLEAMRLLFTERVASYAGRYFEFKGVELAPKPVQDPFPIYVGGNAEAVARRAGRFGQGWIPAGMPVSQMAKLIGSVKAAAREAGRDENTVVIAPQFLACLDKDRETAIAKFKTSQVYQHALSLAKSTLRGQSPDAYIENNLIGSFDDVRGKIQQYIDIGVTCFAGIIFSGNNLADVLEQMKLFAGEIAPQFR